ncbi:MAG: tyrosine-type recombinase/integrase [Clostridia bacterium]|nr:tyrosine-type recombinase/integrase [Clostridia bacterium]
MKKITKSHISRFKEYLLSEEKSAATLEKYMRDINAFFVWLSGRIPDKQKVLEYKEHLLSGYAPTSVNSMLSSLNSFFDFNEWYDLKVKTLRLQKKIFADENKNLTKDEYNRLLKTAKKRKNNRLFLVMQTICATGIRVSELKYITVEATKKGSTVIRCKGKMRQVFLPENLCRLLSYYIKEHKITSGSIFITKTGKPLDRSNVWADMKTLCNDACVSSQKVFPHNLRHLFAKTYYSLQKDIVRLADILGHSSVNTTRIYTMDTSDIHKKQIQELGLLLC